MDKKEKNDKISFSLVNAENGLLNKKGKASKLTIVITCENFNQQTGIEISKGPDVRMIPLATSGQSSKIEIKIRLVSR